MTALESYEREREEFENTLFRPNMEHSTDPNLLDRFQRKLADNTLQSLDPAIQALEMPFLPRGVQTGNARTNLEVFLVFRTCMFQFHRWALVSALIGKWA